MCLRNHIKDDPVEDYIVPGKRDNINNGEEGHRKRWERFQVQFQCALIWVAEMSGHSNIYRYKFPELLNRLNMFPGVQKNQRTFFQRHWTRKAFSIINSCTILTNSHLVSIDCKNYFKLYSIDPTEANFLSSSLPIGNLAFHCIGGEVAT